MKIASGIKKVRVHVWLPEYLATELSILLADPMRGRVKYGELSALGESLFREWVSKQKGEQNGNFIS